MEGYPLGTLPALTLQEGVDRNEINVGNIVSQWLAALDKQSKNGLATSISDLFIEDSWWRDLIGISWDLASRHGLDSIGESLEESTTGFGQLKPVKCGGLQPALVDMHGAIWIQGGFTFKTRDGSGSGLVRSINVSKTQWKAWIVYTQLEKLNNQDEVDKQRLEQDYTQTKLPNGINSEKNGELQVLIIGAGQAGLTLAAQLKHMGVKTLLIDRLPRLGDLWRSRYKTVRAHTPIYTDHYPFLKFPTTWPRWLEQDKIADWMEHYGQIMGLDYMLGTAVNSITYDESSRIYNVEVENAAAIHTFRSRHLVLATGIFAQKPIVPDIPGRDTFSGQIYHSMHHKSAGNTPSLSTKNVVIIGSGTSAHDIAQDFVNSGAESVAIVQRYAIFSMSTAAIEEAYFSLWQSPGVSVEEADIIALSFPTPVARTLNIGQTALIEQRDEELISGLEKAGLKVKHAIEVGYGFLDHVTVKIGQYYFDQGASSMIIDGRIKILHCETGVEKFVDDGFVLGDGRKVDADVVVLATGYERNVVTVKELMGDKIARQVGDLGHLDDEQERIGWWRPTGFAGFWYMTGSFLWCRQYSPILALQISALEQGLNPEYWEQNERNNKGLGTIPR